MMVRQNRKRFERNIHKGKGHTVKWNVRMECSNKVYLNKKKKTLVLEHSTTIK